MHNIRAVGTVQISGGLIRQHQSRIVDQGPANGNALLLTAGKLIGQMMDTIADIQGAQHLSKSLFIRLSSIQQQGQRDVFLHIQYRNEIVELINQSHLPSPENGQLGFIQLINIGAFEKYFPRSGTIHAAQNMKKCGFAGSGRTNNGDKFAFVHRKAHIIQGTDLCFPASICFCQVFHPKDFQNILPPHAKQFSDTKSSSAVCAYFFLPMGSGIILKPACDNPVTIQNVFDF